MKKLLFLLLIIPFISNAGYKKQLDYIDYQGIITVKEGGYTISKNFTSSKIPKALQTVENFYKIEKDIESTARSLLLSSKPSYMSLDYVKAKLNGPLNFLLNGYSFNINNKLILKLQSNPFFKYVWQSCSYNTSIICNEEF